MKYRRLAGTVVAGIACLDEEAVGDRFLCDLGGD